MQIYLKLGEVGLDGADSRMTSSVDNYLWLVVIIWIWSALLMNFHVQTSDTPGGSLAKYSKIMRKYLFVWYHQQVR